MRLHALIEKLALNGWHSTGDEKELTFVNAAVEDEEKTIEFVNGKWRIRHWKKEKK